MDPKFRPNSTTKLDRHVEDLAVTTWRLVEVRGNGIVLRDGPSDDRWSEETLWAPGVTPGRTYAILWEGREYEFRSQLATWNPYSFDRRTSSRVRRRSKAA
jgi:hypothetical protein